MLLTIGRKLGIAYGTLLLILLISSLVTWYILSNLQGDQAVVTQSGTVLLAMLSIVFQTAVYGGIWVWMLNYNLRNGARNLINGIQRVANEQFDQPIQTNEADEFAQIASHFNQMATQLDQVHQQLDSAIPIWKKPLSNRPGSLISMMQIIASSPPWSTRWLIA